MIEVAADRAERLVNQRSAVAVIAGFVLIVTQGQRMDDGGSGPIGWALSGAVAVLFLTWASGVFRGKALRGILNDECSEANRRRAIMIGFWNMIATSIVCYVLTYVKDYGPRDAIQIIMTVGMSSALISFGISERLSTRV